MRLIVLTLILLSARSVFACSCATPTVEREIASASVIFVGTATKLSRTPRVEDSLSEVTFEIHEAWKRAVPRTFTVLTPAFGPACGYLPAIGGQYLVFAYRDDLGRFHISLCSNNQPYECAPPVLRKLGRPMVSHKPLPSLEGLGRDEKPLPPQMQYARCSTPPMAPAGADLALPKGVMLASFSAMVLRNGRMRDVVLTVNCLPGAECPADLRARLKAKYEAVRYEPARWNGTRVAMRITRAPVSRSPR